MFLRNYAVSFLEKGVGGKERKGTWGVGVKNVLFIGDVLNECSQTEIIFNLDLITDISTRLNKRILRFVR